MAGEEAIAEVAQMLAREAVAKLYAGDQASQALGIEVLEVAPGRVRVAMTVRRQCRTVRCGCTASTPSPPPSPTPPAACAAWW